MDQSYMDIPALLPGWYEMYKNEEVGLLWLAISWAW